MDIFESLENLNVSEECFQSILSIIEEYINETSKDTILNLWGKRLRNARDAEFDKNNAERMLVHYSGFRNPKLKSSKKLHVLNKIHDEAWYNYRKETGKKDKTEQHIKSWANKVKGEDAYLNDKVLYPHINYAKKDND